MTRSFQAPVPLTIFRSNLKFDQNLQCSAVKYTLPVTTQFCTCHDRVTFVTCAKFLCRRLKIFSTRALHILIEFRIQSKYRYWDYYAIDTPVEFQYHPMTLGQNFFAGYDISTITLHLHKLPRNADYEIYTEIFIFISDICSLICFTLNISHRRMFQAWITNSFCSFTHASPMLFIFLSFFLNQFIFSIIWVVL